MDNDTRVTVTLWDATNPYHYGEVRGTVIGTTTGQDAADHINALSESTPAGPTPPAPPTPASSAASPRTANA